MTPTPNYRIRQAGRRWLLSYQGRLVGIYFAECDAIRGQLQHLNCNRSTTMKVRVRYHFDGKIEIDDDLRESLIEQLTADGVVGKPTPDEVFSALKTLAEDDPYGILPDIDNLIEQMKLLGVDDNDIEIVVGDE